MLLLLEPAHAAAQTVECVRKILLLSSSTFIAPGTTQISFGMVVCIFSIAVYVHIRPYNARQTDWLQQICQLVLFTTLLLSSCGGDPQPCDTLCESGGYSGVDETHDSCICSGSNGLGGGLNLGDCENYCAEYGVDAEGASLSTTDETNDTCMCESDA